jgi:hypothetical protein
VQQRPVTNSLRSTQTARALLVAMLCAAPALVCFYGSAGACVADPDLGWHLRAGEWILQHRAFPHVDDFSRFGAGRPWQAYSWLFELLLLKLYGWFHLDGVMIYMAAMLTAVTAAVYRMVSRLQPDFTKCAVITTAVMTGISRLYTPRPWLFTILFFVLEIDILMHARRTGRRRLLLWLPPLFALWANIHIQFINGLLVLGVAALEPLLARWWKTPENRLTARSLWITLTASITATCLNPYGLGIYKIAHDLAAQSGVLNTVSEMRALPFRSISDFVLLFLALAAAGVLFRFHRFYPFETLMLVMAAVLSFRSQRDMWFMAVTAAVILAEALPEAPDREREYRQPLWASLIILSATGLFVFASALLLRINNARLEESLAAEMPVQAVKVVQERQYAGAVYNTYGWGGFLIWNLRQPVSIDGRAAFYGDEQIDRSIATWNGGPDWSSDPDLRSAGIVIAPVKTALAQLLRLDSRFTLAYQDKVAAVFIARGTPNKAPGDVAALSPHASSQPEKKL